MTRIRSKRVACQKARPGMQIMRLLLPETRAAARRGLPKEEARGLVGSPKVPKAPNHEVPWRDASDLGEESRRLVDRIRGRRGRGGWVSDRRPSLSRGLLGGVIRERVRVEVFWFVEVEEGLEENKGFILEEACSCFAEIGAEGRST